MAENTILIDINVSSDQLAESNKRISELSASIKDLKEQKKTLNKEDADYEAKLAKINAEIRTQNAELKTHVNLINSENGSLNQMKAQLSLANAERNRMTAAEREGTAEGRRLTQVSKELTDRLKEKEEQVGNNTRSVGNYRLIVKELTAELVQMAMAGQKDTDEYRRKAEQLGEIKDNMADVSAQAKVMGSDTKYIDMMVGSFEALGAGVQVAEGTMQLFGLSSDSVERGIQKLVAIQSLMNGVQTIANSLQKESAFMLGLMEAKTKLATAAQWALNAAKSAGVAGIGLLIAGVAAITTAIVAWTKNTSDQVDQEKALANEIERTNKNIDARIKQQEYKNNLDKAAGEDERKILEANMKLAQENYYLQDKIARDLIAQGAYLTDKKEEEYTEQDRLLKAAIDAREKYAIEYRDIENKITAIGIEQATKREEEINKQQKDANKKQIDDLESLYAEKEKLDQENLNSVVDLNKKRRKEDEEFSKVLEQQAIDRANAVIGAEVSVRNTQQAVSDERELLRLKEKEAYKERMQQSIDYVSSEVANAKTLSDAINGTLNVLRDAIKKEIMARLSIMLTTQMAKVISTLPFPVNVAVVPVALAAVNALYEKFIPKFATGGIVPGYSFSGDRVPILANSGEVILNRSQQQSIGYNAFRRAGVPGFATGGMVGSKGSVQTVLVVEDLNQVTGRMQRTKINSTL